MKNLARYLQPAIGGAGVILTLLAMGCQTSGHDQVSPLTLHDTIERYHAEQSDRLASRLAASERRDSVTFAPICADEGNYLPRDHGDLPIEDNFDGTVLSFGTFGDGAPPDNGPTSRPGAKLGGDRWAVSDGYWRQDIWHQMGHEAKDLITHDFWRGFRSSFWDLENAVTLGATWGASIAIRGTGVDHTIRSRTRGHRQLGDFDEPLQILGNPGTHFAGAGALWLASALTKDVREHEVAKSLTQALAVNGVTTMMLKAACNTRTPDHERLGWPSGHTSSAFTVAAVLNEYYGPWVGVPSLALAGLCGYQRLDSRVHDFSDVVFGAMLGYVIGSSIAREEQARFPEIFGMQIIPYYDEYTGASGLALMKTW